MKNSTKPHIERSLVLIKPDAVRRGLIGEILHRFERAGLKIVGAKIIHADQSVAKKHYQKDEVWQQKVGEFTMKDCMAAGLDIEEFFGTVDATEIGKIVNEWLYEMFTFGPVFAFVMEGPDSVAKIRSLVGSTYPAFAPAGTIRGDFGMDSAIVSMKNKRAVLNLIHASGTPEEATEEIKLWFKEEELISYKTTQDEIYSYCG